MGVTRIEIFDFQQNATPRYYTAKMRFHLTTASDQQITLVSCKTMMAGVENRADAVENLLQDALRQLRWMPEYRLGTLALSDLPAVEELDRSSASAA